MKGNFMWAACVSSCTELFQAFAILKTIHIQSCTIELTQTVHVAIVVAVVLYRTVHIHVS